MIDLDSLFRYKVLNPKKLLDYGFIQQDDCYGKAIPVLNKQFMLRVTVSSDGKISYKVIETAFGEEYILAKVSGATGSFVGEVRSACEKVLADVACKCFDTEILKAEQTKRIVNAAFSLYGAEPEFLWDKYPDCAAFRRKDNAKWFAIIMTIDRSKFGLPGHGNIEIIDLKAGIETVAELLKSENFYPAYHMNKKHWFTVCLDGRVSDEVLLQLLSSSYQCSAKR